MLQSDTSSNAVNDNYPFFFSCSIDNLASSISDENLYATPRGDHPDVVLNGDVSGTGRKASDVEDFVKASTAVAAERSAATLWKGMECSKHATYPSLTRNPVIRAVFD